MELEQILGQEGKMALYRSPDYQTILSQLALLVQEFYIDFQDGCHLGFPIRTILTTFDLQVTSILPIRARENRKNSRSGPKLRILDPFQTPQNATKSVQQVCALNPIFPKQTNFHKSMISKKSQTVKSFQTDNVRALFKCDIMVVKRL